MKTYVCTCGTSIAANRMINLERFIDKPLSEWQERGDEIDSVKKRIADDLKNINLNDDLQSTSAEIKSLIKMGLKKEDSVVLIASDTIDGKLCAESVRDFLTKKDLCSLVDIKPIHGLQAADGTLFQREGIKNLLNYLVHLEHQNIIFNPTGGYKSVVPYIALMGMIFNRPVKYIHENSDDVLSLTGIPIVFDEDLIFRVEEKLRKIEKDTSIQISEWREGIDYHDRRFESLVEIDGSDVTLSGIGVLFWEKFKKDYPPDLARDLCPASEKENKLLHSGVTHHGVEKIKPLAEKLLKSVFVAAILNSCNNQPARKTWIKALIPAEAKNHLQTEKHNICMVTDIRSDAGYSFLLETTARNNEENKRIAKILNRKYFN